MLKRKLDNLNGWFDFLPSDVVIEEIFLFMDHYSLFFRVSKVNKHFRNLINDWNFIYKVYKRNNIFDIVLLEEFQNKLNSPEAKYAIVIKPCINVNNLFKGLSSQGVIFSSSHKIDSDQPTVDSKRTVIVYQPDLNMLKYAIVFVHHSLKKQYPIFLQQLGFLCSFIGSKQPYFQNTVSPYGAYVMKDCPSLSLDNVYAKGLWPFTSYDWAGHGDGGETNAAVVLTNDPSCYGKLYVLYPPYFENELAEDEPEEESEDENEEDHVEEEIEKIKKTREDGLPSFIDDSHCSAIYISGKINETHCNI